MSAGLNEILSSQASSLWENRVKPDLDKVDNSSEYYWDALLIVGGALAIGGGAIVAAPVLAAFLIMSGTLSIATRTVKAIGHTQNSEKLNKELNNLPSNFTGMATMPIDAAVGNDNFTISKTFGMAENLISLKAKPSVIKNFRYRDPAKGVDIVNTLKDTYDISKTLYEK